jgi:hypothetical protein
MARQMLGRRPISSADFQEALSCEWIDLLAEIPNGSALQALGRTVVGPRDGLYVLDETDDTWRVYVQERGVIIEEVRNSTFEQAREFVIDKSILLSGLPFVPVGRPDHRR